MLDVDPTTDFGAIYFDWQLPYKNLAHTYTQILHPKILCEAKSGLLSASLLAFPRLLVLSQGLHLKLRRFILILVNLITLLVLGNVLEPLENQMDMDRSLRLSGSSGPFYWLKIPRQKSAQKCCRK